MASTSLHEMPLMYTHAHMPTVTMYNTNLKRPFFFSHLSLCSNLAPGSQEAHFMEMLEAFAWAFAYSCLHTLRVYWSQCIPAYWILRGLV